MINPAKYMILAWHSIFSDHIIFGDLAPAAWVDRAVLHCATEDVACCMSVTRENGTLQAVKLTVSRSVLTLW